MPTAKVRFNVVLYVSEGDADRFAVLAAVAHQTMHAWMVRAILDKLEAADKAALEQGKAKLGRGTK